MTAAPLPVDPTPAVLPAWAGIAVVLGVLGLALVAIRAVQARRGLAPESARKAIHVTMSAVALSLPWLFDDARPVLLLAVLAVGAMLAVRYVPALRASVGHVLHSVGRTQSLGDVAFPVTIAALYLLTADSPVLYAIPLLLLGLADAGAALVGASYGQAAYTTVEGAKSREGSAAFALIAFLSVHVPLLLFTPIGRPESLWTAAIVAVLAMLVEAVSWRGLDNLFVPLGAYAVLVRLLTLDAITLAGHAVVLLGLLAVAAALRRETTVGGAGVFGAALVAYLAWALGGTAWLLPPALLFLLYTRIWPAAREADGLPHSPTRRPHTAHNVFSVAAVGVLWLVLSRAVGEELLLPYALAFGVHLAFLGVERMQAARPRWTPVQVAWRAAWRSTLVAVGPVLLVWAIQVALGRPAAPPRPMLATAVALAAGLVATGVAAWTLARFRDRLDTRVGEFESRVWRSAVAAPLSALGLLALWLR